MKILSSGRIAGERSTGASTEVRIFDTPEEAEAWENEA